MDKKEEEFFKKLLSMFKVEANEHIGAITRGLIDLEKGPPEKQMENIETVFREAHSLKGAARSVNMKEIESICQSMENVFASLKRNEIAASPRLFDVLHRAADFTGSLVSRDSEMTAEEKFGIKELIQDIESFSQPAAAGEEHEKEEHEKPQVKEEEPARIEPAKIEPEHPSVIAPLPTPPMPAETIRISTAKLDSLLFQVEELLSVKLAAGQRAAELREISASFAAWKKDWAKAHPGASEAQTQDYIKSLESKLTALAKSAEYDSRSHGGMVDNLLDDMKKVLMVPASSLLSIFPKLVRDLSHDRGKEVELVIRGEDIEIDRRILEEIKDPLIHLIRNCIDHGIEKPDERVRKKKPSCGTVQLAILAKDGSKIEIMVSDDGAGIDASKIKSASVARGVKSAEETGKMNDQEALSLIFLSGVSTSPIITEVSGRGLGLAIVREKVEKLNGIVSFDTHPDAGTAFRIVVPLTLATFRGLFVSAGESMFVLPVSNVERVVRVKKDEIRTVENRETISLNGQVVSLVSLMDVLELKTRPIKNDPERMAQVVVLGLAEKRMAFLVDEVLFEQEVLVKNLGRQLTRVRNIAGATVLGSGKVVPILNVHDLIKSGVKAAATASTPAVSARVPGPAHEAGMKMESILVVEDSITSRTLLKNILESAGYDVATAVDGAEAFAALKTREFGLVVSDIDMPRMNGFDLTSKIRGDKKLSELPVVLVTGLESREDRERGIEVGANAYIVKSSFDQSNLLEIIRRLV